MPAQLKSEVEYLNPIVMKTHPDSFFKKRAVFGIALALSALVFPGCEETFKPTDTIQIGDPPKPEFYHVGLSATTITALDNSVIVEIPDNAFEEPTMMFIDYGKDVKADSLILMQKSISITFDDLELRKPICLTFLYDPMELQCDNNAQEACLKIYTYPDMEAKISGAQWFRRADECIVDCVQNTVQARFSYGGTFIVGKPK
jgi:hypothetical protein